MWSIAITPLPPIIGKNSDTKANSGHIALRVLPLLAVHVYPPDYNENFASALFCRTGFTDATHIEHSFLS